MARRTRYQRLVEKNRPPDPPHESVEQELDSLIVILKERQRQTDDGSEPDAPDRIEVLRELTAGELVPTFAELKRKYVSSGVSLEMDVSDFLEGGREIRFDFSFKEYRSQLLGTVTTEAIAFHETRHAPGLNGQLVSGPMLRLRNLDRTAFREFICERLAVLLRAAVRWR